MQYLSNLVLFDPVLNLAQKILQRLLSLPVKFESHGLWVTPGILLHTGGSVSNLTECNSEHLFDMRITVKRVLGKGFTQIKLPKSVCATI